MIESAIHITSMDIGYPSKRREPLTVFEGINASASMGEIVALLGINGIGKSTLLKTLARLIKPLHGSILMAGEPIERIQRNRFAQLIGFVSTEAIMVHYMKVIDVVRLGRFPHTNWIGRMTVEDHEMVERAVDWMEIGHLSNKGLTEISDGERQRVMIARTLAQDTDIIILDEPTAFLDLGTKYEIIRLLNRLSKEFRKCILYSTHELQLSLEEADRVWFMHDGGLHQGAPEDLILDGLFDKVLDRDYMEFDMASGQIRFKKENILTVSINGNGPAIFWTQKALQRIGCRVEENSKLPFHIELRHTKHSMEWHLQKNDEKFVLNNLYDLILHIRTAQNFTN
jgi:iron complex transport system ATP-binding protein